MSVYSANPVPKRVIWPWVLGAVLVAVGSVIVFFTSFAMSAAFGNLADSRAERAAADTVLALDAAYENQDCEAFQSVVNGDLADQLVDDDFDCESWVAIAASLRNDGEYTYSVDVIDVHVDGDDANAYTEEFAGVTYPTNYYYTLHRSDHGWVIVDYDRR